MRETAEISDRDELIAFIEDITNSTDSSSQKWEGARSMVDLCELVKRFAFYPATGGSNSIKKVVPAILEDSKFLQEKYGGNLYGSSELPSKNVQNWQWIKKDAGGKIIDPYSLLPNIFSDLDMAAMDSLITEESIADGGAAMTAYARMQFSEMTAQECEKVATALLKYCELDTFAMVLIYQHWKNVVEYSAKKVA